jgi:hypothetical protein
MMAMLKMGFRAGCAAGFWTAGTLVWSIAVAEVSGFGMVWGLLTAGDCPVWLSFWGAFCPAGGAGREPIGIGPKGENARHL